MKEFITNLIFTFFTCFFVIYLLTQKVEIDGLIVCFISTGVVALGYLAVYLIKKHVIENRISNTDQKKNSVCYELQSV